jgi:hypothetical protein
VRDFCFNGAAILSLLFQADVIAIATDLARDFAVNIISCLMDRISHHSRQAKE